MAIVIGLLTFVMVVDCVVLILLVLMQLPKKEAGAGLAFGGAATDALFGAGSGNFLTKATKYAAILFFVLTIVLALMQSWYSNHSNSAFRRALEKESYQAPPTIPPGVPPSGNAAATTPATSNTMQLLAPSAPETNSAPAK
jgi:preprotein translocase subunit SecG